jgi:hypothetical protein
MAAVDGDNGTGHVSRPVRAKCSPSPLETQVTTMVLPKNAILFLPAHFRREHHILP